MQTLRSAVALAILLIAQPGFAEVPLNEFRKADGMNALLDHTFINGVGEGLSWANVALQGEGKAPLFCVPSTLAFSVDKYVQLLNAYIKKRDGTSNPLPEDSPISGVLFYALKDAYPCKSP